MQNKQTKKKRSTEEICGEETGIEAEPNDPSEESVLGGLGVNVDVVACVLGADSVTAGHGVRKTKVEAGVEVRLADRSTMEIHRKGTERQDKSRSKLTEGENETKQVDGLETHASAA